MANKFFKDAFATGGDKTAIPNPVQPSGQVNYTTGFTINYTYDINTDPNALAFPRDQFNQLGFDITSNLQHWQTHCIPDFITTADNDGSPYSYDKYALVLYTNNIYQSKKDANVSLPTVTTDWKLLDNLQTAVIYDGVDFEGTVVDGEAVYWDAINTEFAKAIADGTEKQNAVGIADTTNKRVFAFGFTDIFSALTPGAIYYLSATTAGEITNTSSGDTNIKIGIALTASALMLDVQIASSTNSRRAFFTANDNWTVPDGVTEADLTMAAGGGGGGGASGGTCGSGGGGGDAVICTRITGLTPGSIIPITVGQGGTKGNGGSTPTNGTAGTASSFGAFLTINGGGAGETVGTGGGVAGGPGATAGGTGSADAPGSGGGSIFAATASTVRTAGSGSAALLPGGYGAGGPGAAVFLGDGHDGLDGFVLVEW